jgi:aspartate kinase
MKVMKFGGGCLKDARSFSQAAAIIAREEARPAVVVSAVSGVTDGLLEACRRAERSERGIPAGLQKIRSVHASLVENLIGDPDLRRRALRIIEARLRKAERLLYGIAYTSEATPSTRSHLLSHGERLAAHLLALILTDRGAPARALESDGIGMITDDTAENATVDLLRFRRNLSHVLPVSRRGKEIPVVTGFFGVTPRGRVATFGRNGSDYSAAVLAHGLEAERLEIWKDVEGFMSADPRRVAGAKKIGRLSYYEAAELSYFGARILHPRTLEPLRGLTIQVVIKSFWEPDRRGTLVLPAGPARRNVIKSVAANPNVALLRIHGPGVGYKPGIIGSLGQRLSALGINIYSIITSQTCINLVVDRRDAARGREALRAERGGVIEGVDLEDDIALIAAVGQGLRHRRGLAARIFSAVARAGVNVEMISSGASEVATYFIVDKRDQDKALQALHREFF